MPNRRVCSWRFQIGLLGALKGQHRLTQMLAAAPQRKGAPFLVCYHRMAAPSYLENRSESVLAGRYIAQGRFYLQPSWMRITLVPLDRLHRHNPTFALPRISNPILRSSSAKADDPVTPGISMRSPKPRRTGHPAFVFGV